MARHAILRCEPQFIATLARGRYEVYLNPLPDDARVVGAWYDPEAGVFCVRLESASFEDVADFQPLPALPPVCVRPVTTTFREFF